MKKGSLILLITGLMLFAACTTEEVCEDASESYLVARMKYIENGSSLDTVVPDLLLWGIRESMPDSLIYDSLSTARLVLPLDPHHNFSTFVMVIDSIYDTLFLEYGVELYLHSQACGFRHAFTLDSVRASGLKILEAETVREDIDATLETNEEHVWLYL